MGHLAQRLSASPNPIVDGAESRSPPDIPLLPRSHAEMEVSWSHTTTAYQASAASGQRDAIKPSADAYSKQSAR